MHTLVRCGALLPVVRLEDLLPMLLQGAAAGRGDIRASLSMLSMDIRAFIRSRVDDEDGLQAEFYDPETGRTTDTSAGAIGSLGAHLYF